jgi:arylformamidase
VRLIDITPVVSPDLEGWPGDTRFHVEARWSQVRGDSCTVSRVTLSSHLGAHADAPLHFAPGGDDAAAMPLDRYIGPARVIQIPGHAAIGPDEALWAAGAERVLYRVLGADAGAGFPGAFAALTPAGAKTLVRLGVRLFGTDAPSVDPVDSRTLEAHHVLHAGGVAILEGLALADVSAGDYELIALPLRWRGVDAAPVRAVLRVPAGETS